MKLYSPPPSREKLVGPILTKFLSRADGSIPDSVAKFQPIPIRDFLVWRDFPKDTLFVRDFTVFKLITT